MGKDFESAQARRDVIADEADSAKIAVLAQSSRSNWDGGGQTGSRTSWLRTTEMPKATSVHVGEKQRLLATEM